MRSILIFFIAICLLSITGCGRGGKINGHTISTAYRSVKSLKERLPTEKRIEFELSFWAAHDAFKDKEEFLDEVDGKTPGEIIDLGKKIYEERKAAGFAAYQKFATWDEMIAYYTRERNEQDRPKSKNSARDKANNVLYKLRNM